jgi:hypothetical protein
MKRLPALGFGAVSVLLLLPTTGRADTAVVPSLGLRASVPLGGSAALTLTVGDNKECCAGCDCTGTEGHHVTGPSLFAEAGSGGGQLGLGYTMIIQEERWHPVLAAGAHAVVVRTWGSPWFTEKNQTYVGGQIGATLMGWGVRVGALKHVQGEPPFRGWMITGGAGWGF